MAAELLVGALVALAVWYWLRRLGRGGATAPPADRGFAKIRGPGRFAQEVVGESHYRAAFETLLGSRAGADEEHFCDALLRLDDNNPHDPLAVSVHVSGHQVGHLPRDMAREFRQALVRDSVSGRREYAVAARVYAGGKKRRFSVQLDLPLAD